MIVFFGALGDNVGGGESGNKRTLLLLEKMGYEVRIVQKPYPMKSKLKYINYPLSLVASIIRFSVMLKGAKYAHISGFYGNLIYIEAILVLVSKLLKKTVIYEIRGGAMDHFLRTRGMFYGSCFKFVIKFSDVILSQGKENFVTIRVLASGRKKIHHYPNVLTEDKIPDSLIGRDYTERLNLIYFGRLVDDKNIDIIVETVKDLVSKNRLNCSLFLLGEFGDSVYQEKIKKNITGFEKYITIIPPLSFKDLRSYLLDSHFFIFPSTNVMEGQSNSLTEALLYGLIPISSYQGFNKSTINDDRFMIKNVNVEAISNKLMELIDLGHDNLNSISRDLQREAREKFTEKKAIKVLNKVYEE
jgi:glycosyltransferase involved in cell wall biosynthesis